jgi:hypothetical protein
MRLRGALKPGSPGYCMPDPVSLALSEDGREWVVSVAGCFPLDEAHEVWNLHADGIAYINNSDDFCDGKGEHPVPAIITLAKR